MTKSSTSPNEKSRLSQHKQNLTELRISETIR